MAQNYYIGDNNNNNNNNNNNKNDDINNATQLSRKNAHNDADTIERLREALATMNAQHVQVKLELDNMTMEYNKLKNNNNFNNSTINNGIDYNNNNNNNNTPSNNVFNKFQKFRTTVLSKNRQFNISSPFNNNNNEDNNHNNHHNHNHNHNHNAIDHDNNETNGTMDHQHQHQHQYHSETGKESKQQLRQERDELLMKYNDAMDQITRLKEQANKDAERMEVFILNREQEQKQLKEALIQEMNNRHEKELNNYKFELEMCKESKKELDNKFQEMQEKWEKKCDLIITERNSLQRRLKILQPNDTTINSTVSSDADILSWQKSASLSNTSTTNNNNNNNNNTNHSDVNTNSPSSLTSMLGIVTQTGSDSSPASKIQELRKEMVEMKRKYENDRNQWISMINRLSSEHNAQSQKGTDIQQLVNSLSITIIEKEEIIKRLKESKHILGERVLQLEEQVRKFTSPSIASEKSGEEEEHNNKD